MLIKTIVLCPSNAGDPHTLAFFFFFLRQDSEQLSVALNYVAKADLELAATLLSQPPECTITLNFNLFLRCENFHMNPIFITGFLRSRMHYSLQETTLVRGSGTSPGATATLPRPPRVASALAGLRRDVHTFCDVTTLTQ